jgi:hypothetical protein
MPVWFHVGDPAAFFRPVAKDNERYAELSVHPEWSFYGPQFPAREELLTQMVNVVLRHPETKFVGVHFGNNPGDPRFVSALLDGCPKFHHRHRGAHRRDRAAGPLLAGPVLCEGPGSPIINCAIAS